MKQIYLPFNAFFMRHIWPITKSDMTLDEAKKYEQPRDWSVENEPTITDEQHHKTRPSRGRKSNPWSWS